VLVLACYLPAGAQEQRRGSQPKELVAVIGKRGRVIQALRQVGRAAGATEGVKVTVEVAE